MTTAYKPRAGSLASQLCYFFSSNPKEELTVEDITAKFDCVQGNVHTLLGESKAAGLLKRDRTEDGEYVYCAGPALLAPSNYSAPIMALSTDLRDAVSAAATKLNRNKDHGATYRVAMVGSNRCLVWRIA